MQISTHDEIMFFCKIHKVHSFCLPCIPVRVRAIFRIRIIPVKVDSHGIEALCSINTGIPAVVCSIRICEGVYVDVNLIDKVRKPGICSISIEQVINIPKHKHVTSGFITMHGGSI